MKKNDIMDLRSRTGDELRRMALDLREEIVMMKKDDAMSKVKNTNAERNKRKDLARVLTFLSIKGEQATAPTQAKAKVEKKEIKTVKKEAKKVEKEAK